MTLSIAVVLGLLGLAVVLFATERLSVDVITILLLLALVTSGILSPEEAFAGFSEDIVVILGSIFVISAALQRSGLMQRLGTRLARTASSSRLALTATVMGVTAGVSSFMNNTTATAMFVTPVVRAAREARVSVSSVLMPLAYASILGGTCTLIGTSTNVAVSGYIAKSGMEPLGFFEITPVGLVIVAVGLVYMLAASRWLIPDRAGVQGEDDTYGIREYLAEIVVLPDSHLIGQRIFDSDLARMDYRILEVIRGEAHFMPGPDTHIEAGDILLVEGRVEGLVKVKTSAGIEMKADATLDRDLAAGDIQIAEALVPRESALVGRTLKEVGFRQRYGLTALAIYRQGQSLRDKIGRIRLRMGDMLLLQGAPERVGAMRSTPDFWILGSLDPALYRPDKGAVALGIFAAAILAGTFDLLPLSVAFLGAAVAVVLTGCVSVEEVYGFVDWRLLILIGGMTAFGTAMEKTGAAQFLAHQIVEWLAPYGVRTILAGFFLVTIVLTQPMSNAAAALVMLPVAIRTAHELGVNERTFAISIMLAASVSFVTPFEPSCILVYGPGKYRFSDFVKVGSILTILLVALVLVLVPEFWPLRHVPHR
jgi:di/tricarboxylate transporter